MSALVPCLIEPLWYQFEALIPPAERPPPAGLPPAEFIFRRELRSLRSGQRDLRGNGAEHRALPTVGIPRALGRSDANLLLELVPDVRRREVFACGPQQYLDAAGCEASARTVECFDIADHAPPAPAGAQVFSVGFVRSGRTIDCAVDAFILDAALAAGIPLPSSCTQGMCGTCKCPLLEGEVEMNHAGGIRPKEIAACKILICCSTPTGNLVIDA
ncbi:2Fe-2S iron-sulfur cluster-binding protein [Arthrobacter sp. MYb227]|uniref:2Fe-2S iron-sulfur cluster-binding protein n=1 Tax=Arthrobacter sp. MYb227 TaxID=1848601 RepID=UPI0015E2EBA1|nr:2Fe-2S iron-sulfur cluster-binding protein [Arthrobacter sp. MYb227]